MTVKELLFTTGGSVKYRIEPYDDEYTVLTKGIVDDIILTMFHMESTK